MLDTEKLRRLQGRLEGRPDRTDTGRLMPMTEKALRSTYPPAELVQAFLVERLLLVAGEPVRVEDGCVLAFTSLARLIEMDPQARPVQKSGIEAAMLAIGQDCPRLLVDGQWVIPRPAVEALAAGDSWLPPWEDAELQYDLGDSVRILPCTDPLVIEVSGSTRQEIEAHLLRISRLPRLGVAADRIEFRPVRL